MSFYYSKEITFDNDNGSKGINGQAKNDRNVSILKYSYSKRSSLTTKRPSKKIPDKRTPFISFTQ